MNRIDSNRVSAVFNVKLRMRSKLGELLNRMIKAQWKPTNFDLEMCVCVLRKRKQAKRKESVKSENGENKWKKNERTMGKSFLFENPQTDGNEGKKNK